MKLVNKTDADIELNCEYGSIVVPANGEYVDRQNPDFRLRHVMFAEHVKIAALRAAGALEIVAGR